MSKRTVTKLWITGLVILVVGLIVAGVGVGLMLAYGGHFIPSATDNGYEFVPNYDDYFWTTVGVVATGATIALAGAITQVAAWVGALVNTNKLESKTWFIVLLVGGILGLHFGLLGFAIMMAYLIAGPDGTMGEQPPSFPSDMRPAMSAGLG